MDDEADVGFVYAHAEGDGGDDHTSIAAHEAVLVRRPESRFESGVIGDRTYAVVAEYPGQVLGIAARRNVDDPLPAHFAAEFDDAASLLLLCAEFLRGIEQVRSKATNTDHVEVATEGARQRGSSLIGGGRGHGQKRGIAELGEGRGNGEVIGPKIVSPERDAVGLVDDDQ